MKSWQMRRKTSLGVRRFLHGDDRERAARFKLIPGIAKGTWIIKQSVGNTPVLLGRKLRTSYFRCVFDSFFAGACSLLLMLLLLIISTRHTEALTNSASVSIAL